MFYTIGPDTQIINAQGYYISPGLWMHVHVESSMMTVGEYARAVLPHGTTTIFMDLMRLLMYWECKELN